MLVKSNGSGKPTLPAPRPPLVLEKAHLDVLRYLRDMGFERADLWEEEVVDALFKARPRYVELVKGHVNACIDITGFGLAALAEAERKS